MNGLSKDADLKIAINYINEATKHLLLVDDKQVEDPLADLSDALWKLRSILNPS